MLWGALVGLVVAIIITVMRALLVKPPCCPACDKPLPHSSRSRVLRECPACGAELKSMPVETTGSGGPILLALIVAAIGIGLIAFFWRDAMEDRRVWLYQQGKLDEIHQQIHDLEGKADDESQKKLNDLHNEIARARWQPDTFRESFYFRLLFVVGGGLCIMIACILAMIPMIRKLRTRRLRPVAVDDA